MQNTFTVSLQKVVDSFNTSTKEITGRLDNIEKTLEIKNK
jgi:hypothetical protein